jgi:mevalonate kinase
MADVTKREVIARAPAKLMLAGEYAVLAGGRALAVTLDCWLTARLRRVAGEGITVRSNLWPSAQHIAPGADLQELRGTPLLHAVAEAAKRYGIERAELSIESTIDVSHGIGSSSALRLAVAMAMAEAHGSWSDESALLDGHTVADAFADATWGAARLAVALQREAQGGASGYDVATQLVGGLVSFTSSDDLSMWPGRIHAFEGASLSRLAQLVHVYVG